MQKKKKNNAKMRLRDLLEKSGNDIMKIDTASASSPVSVFLKIDRQKLTTMPSSGQDEDMTYSHVPFDFADPATFEHLQVLLKSVSGQLPFELTDDILKTAKLLWFDFVVNPSPIFPAIVLQDNDGRIAIVELRENEGDLRELLNEDYGRYLTLAMDGGYLKRAGDVSDWKRNIVAIPARSHYVDGRRQEGQDMRLRVVMAASSPVADENSRENVASRLTQIIFTVLPYLDRKDFRRSFRFREDLGATSDQLIEIGARIEDEFDMSMPLDAVEEFKTEDDYFNYIMTEIALTAPMKSPPDDKGKPTSAQTSGDGISSSPVGGGKLVSKLRQWAQEHQGETIDKIQQEVADEYGVSLMTVSRVFKESGIKSRGYPINESVLALRQWAEKHRGENIDKIQQEVADEYGVSSVTVSVVFQEFGIQSRGNPSNESILALRQWAEEHRGEKVDKSLRGYAQDFGVSYESIRTVFTEFGIQSRGKKAGSASSQARGGGTSSSSVEDKNSKENVARRLAEIIFTVLPYLAGKDFRLSFRFKEDLEATSDQITEIGARIEDEFDMSMPLDAVEEFKAGEDYLNYIMEEIALTALMKSPSDDKEKPASSPVKAPALKDAIEEVERSPYFKNNLELSKRFFPWAEEDWQAFKEDVREGKNNKINQLRETIFKIDFGIAANTPDTDREGMMALDIFNIFHEFESAKASSNDRLEQQDMEMRLLTIRARNFSPEQQKQSSSPVSSERRTTKKVGGIDLNPALLDLQIKRDGNGVPLPLPQQPIEAMRIDGFVPIIINITPIPNLPMLLGLADTGPDTQETRPALKAREIESVGLLN